MKYEFLNTKLFIYEINIDGDVYGIEMSKKNCIMSIFLHEIYYIYFDIALYDILISIRAKYIFLI